MLQAVAVIPLVQLMALAVPPADLNPSFRYLQIALLASIAVFVVARLAQTAPEELGLRLRLRDVALAFVTSPAYLALGVLTREMARPMPLVFLAEPGRALLPATALAIGALVESVLFRGLLQTYAVRVLGPWGGIAYASFLFAAVAVVDSSPGVVILGLYASFMFGFATLATGSIYPAAAGQFTMNLSLFIGDPFQGN